MKQHITEYIMNRDILELQELLSNGYKSILEKQMLDRGFTKDELETVIAVLDGFNSPQRTNNRCMTYDALNGFCESPIG